MSDFSNLLRPIGGMTDQAKAIFDHIEQLLHNATMNPTPPPQGQPVPIAKPPDAIITPPTVVVPRPVVTPTDLPWMINAKKELGVAEIPGGNNSRIVWYHSFTTLHASYQSVSWCSSFANAMLRTANIPGTGSAAALDWINLNWGIELKYAIYGCLVIYDWGNGHGHVGFVIDANDDGIHVLGGNQHDNAKGVDLVCIKMFPWSLAPASFKWPHNYPLPKDAEVDNS